MEKLKYPKNRKSAPIVVAMCVDCNSEFNKPVHNKIRCDDCKIVYHNNNLRKNHIKRYGQKEYRDNMLSVNKKWRENNRERTNELSRKRNLQIPEKIMAREAARKIKTAEYCGICKSTKNLQKHHWRYDKPLLVSTLCSYCHKVQHIKRPMEVLI